MLASVASAFRAAYQAVLPPTMVDQASAQTTQADSPDATAHPSAFFVQTTQRFHQARAVFGSGVDATASCVRAFMPEPLRSMPTSTGVRLVAGAAGLYDFVPDGSLDTLVGALGAMYAANVAFSSLVGTNLRGLDTALPLSVAAFHAFRIYAGAAPFNLSIINFNEVFFFRFIAELGNYLTLLPMLGRFYLRPDLRAQLAQEYGMEADPNVGARMDYGKFARMANDSKYLPQSVKEALQVLDRIPKAPLLGLLIDVTLGRLLSVLAPQQERAWLRPITLWSHPTSHPALQRMARIFMRGHGGKNQNDLMKPQMTGAGRLLTLVQGMAVNVPYQGALAFAQGMDAWNWIFNRATKMAMWSYLGQPAKVRLGGDLPRAQLAGFAIGILFMDLPISLFFNPRYSQREWAPGFHEALAEVASAEGPTRDAIVRAQAVEILDDVVVGQMTAWDLTDAADHFSRTGEWRIGFYQGKFWTTLEDEVAHLTPQERYALEQVTRVLQEMTPERYIEREGIDGLQLVVDSIAQVVP